MWKAILGFRSLGGVAQKVMGGLIRAGVREAIHTVPGVGSVVRLVEELADRGTDRLEQSTGAIPDLKADGESYPPEQLQAIEDWMQSVQDSLGQLTGKISQIVSEQDARSWDQVYQLVQDALEKNSQWAEEFSRVEKQLREQTLSLHRIEQILTKVCHGQRGIRQSLREIKQMLIDSPLAVEWIRFRKADPDVVDSMIRADELILSGKREEGEELYIQILRKRGMHTGIVARHFGLNGRLRGESEKVAIVLEKAEVEPKVIAEATQVAGSFSTHRSQPSGPTWETLPRDLEIQHKYRILEEIGRGGMASVYSVLGIARRNAGTIFALKIPAPAFFSDPSFAERFTNEIDLSLNLAKAIEREETLGRSRPPIVRAHEEVIFIDPHSGKKLSGLVMDWIDGRTLAKDIENRAALAQPFTVEEILAMISPICDALDFAHQQKPSVIHRDGTPRNILIDRNNKVCLTDFGIGRVLAETKTAHITQTGAVVGTLAYLPDELLDPRNRDKVGPHTDVFILGKVLTELMTFSPHGYIDDGLGYPEAWLEVVGRATNRVPKLRYPSAGAFKQALLGSLPGKQEELQQKMAENLKRWQASTNPRKFVEPRLNGWNHEQWQRLLEQVKTSKFWPIDEAELGQSLEETRLEMVAEQEQQRKEKERQEREERDRLRKEKERKDKEEQERQAEAERKRPPDLLVAPFNERKAKEAQTAWATYLSRKVVEEFDLGKGVKLSMALIPPGTFMMGSPDSEAQRSDDERLHEVTLTKPFYMGIHTVTQEQWQAIMGDNPSQFKGAKNLPVEEVSWDDCIEFCEKLSERVGRHFTLPTEAQWEYACRAGTKTPFFFGGTISTAEANYDGRETYGRGQKGEYRAKTTPVGTFRPNYWGLQDMHGNVLEWCLDWYSEETYNIDECTDPLGPDEGSNRVIRGGSWYNDPGICRSASRGRSAPGGRISFLGFRVLSSPSGL